jgi:hypothetical protein
MILCALGFANVRYMSLLVVLRRMQLVDDLARYRSAPVDSKITQSSQGPSMLTCNGATRAILYVAAGSIAASATSTIAPHTPRSERRMFSYPWF